jgi:hypothetical protein
MLKSLSLATGGYLSSGEYSSLSIAINGMIFTDVSIPISLDVTAGFLRDSHKPEFDSELHKSIFHKSDKVAFNDKGVSAQHLNNDLTVNYNETDNVMYNERVVKSSIRKSSSQASYIVSDIKVKFN